MIAGFGSKWVRWTENRYQDAMVGGVVHRKTPPRVEHPARAKEAFRLTAPATYQR